jgi:hypothetical protein
VGNGPSGFDKSRAVGRSVQTCCWIEIELLDEDDEPVAGEKYRVEQSNGQILEGKLDHKGFVRLASVACGICNITFPELDKTSWERI